MKRSPRKLNLSRETLVALESHQISELEAKMAGAGTVRTVCGTCPPATCTSRHVASLCLRC